MSNYFPKLKTGKTFIDKSTSHYTITLLKKNCQTYEAWIDFAVAYTTTADIFFAVHYLLSSRHELGMRESYTFTITVISSNEHLHLLLHWVIAKLRHQLPNTSFNKDGLSIVMII
jgi:hypothetical protein